VEAEEVDDVTEQYGVTTVPYFVMLQVRCQHMQQAQRTAQSTSEPPAVLCASAVTLRSWPATQQ
jgi:hypothetical protein